MLFSQGNIDCKPIEAMYDESMVICSPVLFKHRLSIQNYVLRILTILINSFSEW